MNKIFLFIFLLISSFAFSQNFEITTLRLGDLKLHMTATDAARILKSRVGTPDDKGNGFPVKYAGETVLVYAYETYSSEKKPSEIHISSLSTTSPKFRTKSGIGVGSTRAQLMQAYSNFSDFSVRTGWTEDGKRNKNESYFTLSDIDASTSLMFRLINNKVVEVTVYIEEGGC